jgi:RNA polymerase sigma factor (sigma-70 family)
MPAGLQTLVDRLRGAVSRDALAEATDAALLRRFADGRDEVAFAELVHRHAPAVYALCRRHLTRPADLDDAFQATFVVLAQKAGTVAKPDRLSAWLCGVADRVARKARARAAKRAGKEQPLGGIEPAAATPDPETDLRAVLDDELRHLPAEYRAAVVLCDVDGVSRREAARRLGIPDGTLSNRLARARAMLGRRLLRRGVALGAGISLNAAAAGTPPTRLVGLAVRAAFADTAPAELTQLLSTGYRLMPNAKHLLAALAGVTLIGGTVVGVMVFMQSKTPQTATTDGGAKMATTPATRAAPPDPNKPRQPWPEPKFGESINASAFSPDRTLVVMAQDYRNTAAGGTRLRMFDTATWKEVRTLDLPEYRDFLRGLALTADGKRAFIGGDNYGVQIWDTDTGKLGKVLDAGPGKSMCRSLRLSPDGKLLAGNLVFVEGRSQGVRLWDATSGEVVRTIPIPNDLSFDYPITFTDSGGTVAGICNSDKESGFRGVIEWDVTTGAEKRRLDVAAAVGPCKRWPSPVVPNPFRVVLQSLSYTADGKSAVVGGGHMAPEEKVMGKRERSGGATPYTFSGNLWVINRESGKLVKTLIEDRTDLVRSAGVAADGKKLLVTLTIPSRTGTYLNTDDEFVEIQRWDTASWERDWVKFADKAERWKMLAGADR